MTRLERLRTASVPKLIVGACVLSLFGLFLIVCSVLVPRPLVVIGAMSIGHAVGGAGFACYLLAVLLDTARRTTKSTSIDARPDGSPPSEAR